MKRIQTRTGLAELYMVDPRLIRKWLIELGITHRNALRPLELEMFIQKVGDPKKVKQLHAQLHT